MVLRAWLLNTTNEERAAIWVNLTFSSEIERGEISDRRSATSEVEDNDAVTRLLSAVCQPFVISLNLTCAECRFAVIADG